MNVMTPSEVLNSIAGKCLAFSLAHGVQLYYYVVRESNDGVLTYRACFDAPEGHPLLCPQNMDLGRYITIFTEMVFELPDGRSLLFDFHPSPSGLMWYFEWTIFEVNLLFSGIASAS
ncbi:hypothetical protein O0L34_g16910 [Tuta absoluta]|nr:hypothetical protein O0L34_g16910 [Tuta absoluta]